MTSRELEAYLFTTQNLEERKEAAAEAKYAFKIMGNKWTKARKSKEPPPNRIMLVGLRYAGKRTLLEKLHSGDLQTEAPASCPTFSLEDLPLHSDTQFDLLEMGGRSPIRSLLRFYLANVKGLVFMVDSADEGRLELAAGYLERFTAEEAGQGIPILVLANKADLPNAMPLKRVQAVLRLDQLKQQPCTAFAVSVTTFEGMVEAFGWLANQIGGDASDGVVEKSKTQDAEGTITVATKDSRKLQHLAGRLIPKTVYKLLFA